MKSKQNFKIDVPAPCDQDFTQMPRTGNGFFCSACDKVVTDFASMSDFELVRFLQTNSKKSVCGKFRNDQLHKTYNAKSITEKSSAAARWMLAAFLAVRLPISAQDSAEAFPKVSSNAVTPDLKNDSTLSLKGKVFHRENKEGISVVIRIYAGTKDRTHLLGSYRSDPYGLYEVFIPRGHTETFYTLVFGDENFQERKVVVDRRKLPKFLQVSVLPLAQIDVVAPPVEVTGGPYLIEDRVYVTAGVPVMYHEDIIYNPPVTRIKFFFIRMKHGISHLFSKRSR